MESSATYEGYETYRQEGSATPRVLVADDQPHIVDALELLLKSQGYRMAAVNHPARVLQALERYEFDVVLMDLNYTRDTTAGGEGLELVSQIRARAASAVR
jgi:CheY-like chemotaxis protein